MAKNMCFVKDAEEIHDIMYSVNGIELNDCITAIVGLSRIVSELQEQNKRRCSEIDKLNLKIRELKRGV